jgi:hypothetical protein
VKCSAKKHFNLAFTITFRNANTRAGEPISSHAKGYEAVVHFGHAHSDSFSNQHPMFIRTAGKRKPGSTDARAPFGEVVAVKVSVLQLQGSRT